MGNKIKLVLIGIFCMYMCILNVVLYYLWRSSIILLVCSGIFLILSFIVSIFAITYKENIDKEKDHQIV